MRTRVQGPRPGAVSTGKLQAGLQDPMGSSTLGVWQLCLQPLERASPCPASPGCGLWHHSSQACPRQFPGQQLCGQVSPSALSPAAPSCPAWCAGSTASSSGSSSAPGWRILPSATRSSTTSVASSSTFKTGPSPCKWLCRPSLSIPSRAQCPNHVPSPACALPQPRLPGAGARPWRKGPG